MKLFFILLFLMSACSSLKTNRVILYFHGMGENPFESEKENIEVIRKMADEKGYSFYPLMASGNCYYLAPKYQHFKCWDHQNIETEIERVLKDIGPRGGREIILIGYSNGAYLLAGAFQRNLLADISRVGLISGGPVGNVKPRISEKSPRIYIENAKQDTANYKWSLDFKELIKETSNLSYREVDRSHQISALEMRSFVSWLLGTPPL